MARHAPCRPAMLVGLLLLTALAACDARRPQQRQDIQVTPSEPMDSGGWRPVIDSRISYEVRPQPPTSPDQADQTVDLVPPPQVLREVAKPVKKIKPTRKPNVKGPAFSEISGSETRVTPSGYTLPPPEGPTRPMRFPDDKRRQTVRIQRPSPQHHHYHVRQNGYVGSESTQQLRFRPSPHVSAAYENPYPGWLLQNEEPGLQQQQAYYNADSAGHVQLQYPDAQLQLAIAQQQPDLAQQQQQQQYQAQQQAEIGGQFQTSSYLPGTQQIFGNAGLFNINPALQKDRRPVQDNNLFLVPAATEPSVHENEVPQGPQNYHTTRGRPVRPLFDITTDVPKFQITQPTIPTYQQPDKSELRPRRPRPPTGIQSQLESNRRPVNEEIENANPTVSRPSEQARPEEGQYRPRHPRPPSTEPPSWSHPMQEVDPNLRLRRPRPPQGQGQFQAEESATPETIRYRRPRPPVQEIENPENVRVRRPNRPPVQQEQWRTTTQEPEQENVRPTQQAEAETQENLRPRRPRPPPPVQEEFEDDVERPVFTMKHKRPIPVSSESEEEVEAPRVRRPKPQVVQQEEEVVEDVKPEEHAAQEDVDETVNVRPRRPRPPVDEENTRVRRPRPPTDIIRRRRPKPPVVEDEVVEPPRRRRPQRPVVEDKEQQDRRANKLSKPAEEVVSEEVELKPEEEIIPEVIEFATEAPPSPPDTTATPTTTTPAPLIPSIPPKRRRPLRPVEVEQEDSEVTENYPSQFRATSTPATPTTTLPPSTTLSIISSRLRQRLNSTRPRFSVGDYKDRLNRLTALNNKKSSDDATSVPPTGEDNSRLRQRNRESSRFNIRSTTTTEEPNVERTTFKPVSRYSRPDNKFYSRYRASTEEPGTTPANHDATRRTSTDIFAVKGRRPYPLKTRITADIDNASENTDVETDTEIPFTSVAYSVSEITTSSPNEDMMTTTMQEDEEEINTDAPTTSAPEPVATTDAEDFSPAKRVTDLTSSATAFKPLSYFSAVPADGKHASQLLSRFTMATEDPILPLQAFFPTFTSRPPQQED